MSLDTQMEKQQHTALQLRVVEAILFAAKEPLDEQTIAIHMQRGEAGQGADIPALLYQLQNQYQVQAHGFELIVTAGKWTLRSCPDMADYLRTETTKPMKLSRAMSEVLAIVAYHQPVTRAEVEAIRGVATSKGTLDFLMEVGWVRPGRRRETAGKPLTFITTPAFLDHFGLGSSNDLPALSELRAAGLLESKGSATYGVVSSSVEAVLLDAIEGDGSEDGRDPDFMPSVETLADQRDDALENDETSQDEIALELVEEAVATKIDDEALALEAEAVG